MTETFIANTAIPKTIWMYWAQGIDYAPFLVKQSVQTWRHHNPGWELRVLDKKTLLNFVDLEPFTDREDIPLQQLSDILRVRLLIQNGGVWADATLVCTLPLDKWLPAAIHKNFFCFSSDRKDRIMTDWFLAGSKDSALLNAWATTMDKYWEAGKFRSAGFWQRQTVRKLMSLRKRGFLDEDVWFSNFVRKRLQVFPYPVNMYLFKKALEDDLQLQEIWKETKSLKDAPAEHLQNILSMNAELNPESESYLSSNSTPMHKLNWREDIGQAKEGSNLSFLLKANGVVD